MHTNKLIFFKTKAIILATGGAQQVFKINIGSNEMTGDGYAMALELGLPLINMEFVQFNPAVIKKKKIVLSAPVWRLHPRLYNVKNEELLSNYIPKNVTEYDIFQKKVAPFSCNDISKFFDISIFKEIKEGRGTKNDSIFMDLTNLKELKNKIPAIFYHLKKVGINPNKEYIEFSLAAQCMNGGILIKGINGETDIADLYVAGEVAGGLRGPDRPGGNSLAEGQVFGNRAGIAASFF